MAKRTLIIGGSSGIGRELVNSERMKGNKIIATYNANNKALAKLDITTFKLNLNSEESMGQFIEKIIENKLQFERVFLCGALTGEGINKEDCSFKSGNAYEAISKYMQINCSSYIYILYKLLGNDLLDGSSRICALSSIAGSTSLRGKMIHNREGGNLAYRISKAALNNAIRNIAYDISFSHSDIIIYSVHPGWVATDSGGMNANVRPTECAIKLSRVCDQVSKAQNGLFMDLNGVPLEP